MPSVPLSQIDTLHSRFVAVQDKDINPNWQRARRAFFVSSHLCQVEGAEGKCRTLWWAIHVLSYGKAVQLLRLDGHGGLRSTTVQWTTTGTHGLALLELEPKCW